MDSNKSRTAKKPPRAAVQPQRRHGRERVARLLEVGAALIAEKGYEAATMAEIAERSGSPIGSLYRFFPSKEVLAEALIQRYATAIGDEFRRIDELARTSSIEAVADALIDFTVNRQSETKVIVALLEARSEWPARRQQFRRSILQHIAGTLTVLAPHLPAATARDMAIVLFLNMKTMKALRSQQNVPSSPGAIEELRGMNRLYLATRLAPFRKSSKSR